MKKYTKEQFKQFVASLVSEGNLRIKLLEVTDVGANSIINAVRDHDPVLADMLKKIDTDAAENLKKVLKHIAGRKEGLN